MVLTASALVRSYLNKGFALSVFLVGGLAIFLSSVAYLVSLAGVDAGPLATRQLVIIDTDPGVDDAVAIFTTLGDPSVKVLAITCVKGNTGVPNVVINALKVLALANTYKVPVYTGKNFGLLVSPVDDNWFGIDGLEDVPFKDPPSPAEAEAEHAASFLARIVKEYPGQITIISLGPLTNIALALQLNPDFLIQAQRVVILGGSIRGNGNSLPGVEFNFYMDPDSAMLVFERASLSKKTITLMPMETVNDNALTLDWRWKTLANINNSAVAFMNKVEKKYQAAHPTTFYNTFDVFAAAIVLCPEFVDYSQEYYAFVENKSDRMQGALVLDYSNITQNLPNVEVVMEVNITVLKQKMVDSFASFD